MKGSWAKTTANIHFHCIQLT